MAKSDHWKLCPDCIRVRRDAPDSKCARHGSTAGAPRGHGQVRSLEAPCDLCGLGAPELMMVDGRRVPRHGTCEVAVDRARAQRPETAIPCSCDPLSSRGCACRAEGARQAYALAIEAAAKVCDDWGNASEAMCVESVAPRCAIKIRALLEKGGS